ncbi:FkbM family methyltransferase [Phenylobacterium sp.]|uniref:FkbM family methyltransferase n=1 Tax=Phenylobacterium sp. TaxID=1871053 RepID=UPI002734905A|nr:FkbM family methyltransferase [Phenylobacterium sp.]MDP3660063.1 FkbM family methyltransferase [Phenylobacterium sp.]
MKAVRANLMALSALMKVARSVTFSQYGEDLLLAHSLSPGRSGRYVDAGAYHAWRGSNTYKLYLRGWSGLTIEPNPDAALLFRRMRPRDIHVTEGIASASSQMTYYRFEDGKRNTFSPDQVQAARRETQLREPLNVPVRPLQAIIDEHFPDGRIDLLSVDCEGFDLVVLETLDFGRSRPTAIIIEDFEAFNNLKTGAGDSPIEAHLRSRSYAPIGQAMFSTLYVDLMALAERRHGAFDLASVQMGV